jgi:hypothetical protein
MHHRQYSLMLGRAPEYFWIECFVRETKRFMVEQNLILFYPWCFYATQKYHVMRRGICRTYVRYGTKMYGNRNYYRPPLDEASSIGHPPHSSASPVELRLRVGPRALSGKKKLLR